MIGNRFLQRKPDEALERQPVAQRLLEFHVGQSIKRLQQQRLEHHQRFVCRTTGALVVAQTRKKLLEPIPLHHTRQTLKPAGTLRLRHQRFDKTELPAVANRHPNISHQPDRSESQSSNFATGPAGEKMARRVR